MPTMRLAVRRLLDAESRQLNMAVRDQTIYLSKGEIPGRRGRRPKP
jgi:hypothetical protein